MESSIICWWASIYEEVHAVNRNDAIETAKARNPKARVISTNPDLSQ